MSNQTHLVLASGKLAPQTENAFNSKVAFRLNIGKIPHQFRRRRRGVPQLPAALFRGPGQLVSGNLNLLRLDLDAVGAGGLAHTKPRQEVLQGRNEAGMHHQVLEEDQNNFCRCSVQDSNASRRGTVYRRKRVFRNFF